MTNPETKSPQSEKTNTDSWPKQCCWISIGLVLDWGLWFSAVLIPLVQVGRDGGWRSKQRKEKNLLRLLNSCQGWENSHWPVDLAAIRAPSPGPYLTSRLCSYTNSKKTKVIHKICGLYIAFCAFNPQKICLRDVNRAISTRTNVQTHTYTPFAPHVVPPHPSAQLCPTPGGSQQLERH